MTIVFDAANCVAGTGTTATVPLTVAGVNRYLAFGARVRDAAPVTITSATYAGVPLTQLYFNQAASFGTWWVYYMVNPAVGLNNLLVNFSGSSVSAVAAASYTGVDQANPHVDTDNTLFDTVVTTTSTVTTQVGNHVVSFLGVKGLNGVNFYTPTAPLTSRAECGVTGSTDERSTYAGVADQPGLAGSTDSTWTFSAPGYGSNVSIALRPFVSGRSRATRYYFNLWDPKARVRDAQDRIVPANEIEADTWIEIQGAKLPQSEVYDTYVRDITKARIVEVEASDRGATMKANRSQFADILISRAAGGRS